MYLIVRWAPREDKSVGLLCSFVSCVMSYFCIMAGVETVYCYLNFPRHIQCMWPRRYILFYLVQLGNFKIPTWLPSVITFDFNQKLNVFFGNYRCKRVVYYCFFAFRFPRYYIAPGSRRSVFWILYSRFRKWFIEYFWWYLTNCVCFLNHLWHRWVWIYGCISSIVL